MRTGLLVAAAVGLSGCIDAIDHSWFDPVPLAAYTFPNNEIPEELLELVELAGTAVPGDPEAPTLYGVWARSCQGLADCAQTARSAGAPTVLYFHGNSGNLDHYWDRVQMLWRLGFTVFAIDYRGYGRSTGTPTELGLYADGRTAWQEATSHAATSVAVYGWSLGSTAAVQLCTEQAPPALVLESPLASGQAFVDDAVGIGIERHVLMDTAFDNLGKIPEVSAPKLILHGTADTFVRIEFGRALFRAALEPKQMIEVTGAEHGNVPCPARDTAIPAEEDPCIATPEYEQAVGGFLEAHGAEIL